MYCVYLTSYSGNKMPPFYIGSTSVDKINKGYRGSVLSKEYKEIFKEEVKTRPHLFKTKIISLHKNRTEALLKEDMFLRALSAIDSQMYINKNYAHGFGFSTSGKNNGFFGKKHSEETKIKMRKPKSEEHKKRISASRKGRKGVPSRPKGVPWSEKEKKSRTYSCIHCGITTIKTNITRYHNEKCKFR